MTHVHLIGIGGTGISAIARLLLERGVVVSGSDQTLSPLAQKLERDGVKVYVGHQAQQIEGADLIVRSSAIPDDNVEVLAARSTPGGVLLLSGILHEDNFEVRRRYQGLGCSVVRNRMLEEFTTVLLRSRE